MGNKYWSCEELSKVDAQYYMPLSPRGVGKSYSITSMILKNAYEKVVNVKSYSYDNYMFAYLRRYDRDIKNDDVTAYFADIQVDKITNGEWDSVACVRGWIYFAKHNSEENEKDLTYSRRIGKAFAMTSAEHYKSLKYPDICDIIVEEFVTDSNYLANEPNRLQELISTILRDRPGRVWLIGNTLSKVSPYFTEWGLDCVRDMESGEIRVIEVHGKDKHDEEYVTRIAVEIATADKKSTSMFFGQRGRSITGAQVWTGDRHPRLPASYRGDYDVLYEIELREFNFSFVIQELCHKESGDLVLYIYENTKRRHIDRVLTTDFSIERLTSRTLYDNIKAEQNIRMLLEQHKYCFSNDTTGDDFEHVVENREAGW